MHSGFNIPKNTTIHQMLASLDEAKVADSMDQPCKGLDGKQHVGNDLSDYIRFLFEECAQHPDMYLQAPMDQDRPLKTTPDNPSKVKNFYPVIHA